MAALLTACATNPPTGPVYDPLESVNRKVYAFNQTADKYVLKPIAIGYRFILPDIVEQGISNVFSNIDDINVVVNDLLQGKFSQALDDSGRFFLNSTVGILGLIDVGTRVGLPKHNEGFGQTFGVWGIGEGPYVVLPLFGPNNLRGTAGLVVNNVTTSPTFYIDHDRTRWTVVGTNIVSTRAQLLSAGRILDQAALDPYLFVRDFWVQQNRLATHDGRLPAPDTPTDGDDSDELDELDRLDELDELDLLDQEDQPDKP